MRRLKYRISRFEMSDIRELNERRQFKRSSQLRYSLTQYIQPCLNVTVTAQLLVYEIQMQSLTASENEE